LQSPPIQRLDITNFNTSTLSPHPYLYANIFTAESESERSKKCMREGEEEQGNENGLRV
jgi:hypothetical protein